MISPHVIASAAKQIQNLSVEAVWICFAALAMTEQGASASFSNSHLRCRHTSAASRRVRPSFASSLHPQSREGAGKAGYRLVPTVRCAKAHAEKLHSGIQVKPNTRPSLRSGWTAYAALSREPNSFWPPSPQRKSPTPRRLTRMPHSQTAWP